MQEVTITGTRTNSLFNFQSQTVDWTRYYHSKGAEFLFNLESSDVVGGGGGNANPHTGYSWYDCPVENPPASPIGDAVKDAIQKNQTDAQNTDAYFGQLLYKIINHSRNN